MLSLLHNLFFGGVALEEAFLPLSMAERYGASVKDCLNATKEFILSAAANQYVSTEGEQDAKKL